MSSGQIKFGVPNGNSARGIHHARTTWQALWRKCACRDRRLATGGVAGSCPVAQRRGSSPRSSSKRRRISAGMRSPYARDGPPKMRVLFCERLKAVNKCVWMIHQQVLEWSCSHKKARMSSSAIRLMISQITGHARSGSSQTRERSSSAAAKFSASVPSLNLVSASTS
jgi:hypothetical protein